MTLQLRELERVARVLAERLKGHRIQAVVQPDAVSVVLTTYGGAEDERSGHRRHLLLSCRAGSARASLLAEPPRGLPAPPAFAQYLRAHLLRGRIRDAHLLDGDRQLVLDVETREGRFALLLSILGPRSNLYALEGEPHRGRLVAALRPLAATRAELVLGEPWQSPRSGPPRVGEDRFADAPDAGLLEAIEAHYGAADRESGAAAQLRRVLQALAREEKLLDRKLEKLERELAKAREGVGLERQGELLKGVLSRVRRGAGEVVARDHETGRDVTIALDPALAPAENLEAIFKRYRKAVRTLTKGGAQEQAVRADREALAAEREALAALREAAGDGDAPDAGALEAFAARPAVAKLLRKFATKSGEPARRAGPGGERVSQLGGRKVPARLVPRRYRTAAGLEVWVGRNDAGNDFLSTRLARGNDLFFHLDGAPGSHVVLRTEGRVDPPAEAVLDACELAVHFSKAKKATRADVHVVPIKNVRKPRGAKPGLVMVHGGRSIHLRRTPARLERVLSARVEDAD